MQKRPPKDNLQFRDLSIQGFRGIKSLSIPQLGRVTLITGKNNTGKSSILEALRIYTNNAAPYLIYDILSSREEHMRGTDEEERSSDPESLFQISALFNGYPRLSEDFAPITISTTGKTHPVKLVMQVSWFAEQEDSDGNAKLVMRDDLSDWASGDVAALVVQTEERRQTHRLERFLRYARSTRMPRPGLSDRVRMPCIFVSPYAGEVTNALERLWAGVALTDNEKDVVEALQIIDPHISAVSMVAGEVSFKVRTAIVRSKSFRRPVPLRSFGDGLNRLFAIALSIVNAREGLLLIDEFENGLHYSVQLDAWRMIFRLAQELDVQVIATSHSWDTIEALQKAAAEAPEEGVLVHLTARDDDIIPTVFTKDELAIVTRDKIEVR